MCAAQDLPFSYRFAYVVNDVETLLVATEQSSGSLDGFRLPVGRSGDRLVFFVTYVRDAFGGQARSMVGSEFTWNVNVTSRPFVVSGGGDAAASLESLQSSLLDDALRAGDVSTVLANAAILAKVLTAAQDPCASVSCGEFGTCFEGACACKPESGYSGAACDVAPTVVTGEWVADGVCRGTCGVGTQRFKRTCTPSSPLRTDLCVGQVSKVEPCDLGACTGGPVNGGYTEWTEGVCSVTCSPSSSGIVTGTRVRTRVCENPFPSAGGADCSSLGPATESGAHARYCVRVAAASCSSEK